MYITKKEENNGLYWIDTHQHDSILEDDKFRTYHFEIYPGPIGANVYVVCDKCKKRHDITDYDLW